MPSIRPCRDDERTVLLEIINAAAQAYRGVIPPDQWHDPYMGLQELNSEISAGVVFWAYEQGGEVIGVMAIAFYQKNGFVSVPAESKSAVLKTYWTIPDRQVETSVVLANPLLASAS